MANNRVDLRHCSCVICRRAYCGRFLDRKGRNQHPDPSYGGYDRCRDSRGLCLRKGKLRQATWINLACFRTIMLSLALKPGQALVMGNLSAHKGSRVRELIEAKGASFSTYYPTRQTSTPSRRRSRRSRRCYGGQEHAFVR